MAEYRIVITHDKKHDDHFEIQKKNVIFGIIWNWEHVKTFIRKSGVTLSDHVDYVHTELINYIQYGQ